MRRAMQATQEHRSLWEGALSQIEIEVSKPNFRTWFKETSIVRVEEGTVFVGVPNPFAKDWLQTKFHRVILRSLRERDAGVRAVEYLIVKEGARREPAAASASVQVSVARELPLAEHYVNRDDNLNPRYTFESFVVGPFNELAFAASQAVVRQPGIAYNPLFIYGSTGHGKTHLIQAIGNAIKAVHPSKKVFYMTSERFAADFFQSLQSNKMQQFKDRYRRFDVLIMDDIQFFSSKEKTQEELFHLFNALYDSNRQIVFSSDKHPNYIPNLEDRLRSRFGQGMIVDIPKPDLESRAMILKAKLGAAKVELDDQSLTELAESLDGNIRELEGVVNSVTCQAALKGRPLTNGEVKEIVRTNARPKKSISHEEVIRAVSTYFGIEPESIADKTRRKEVVLPRQLTMYILRNDFGISYPTIGDKMGGRDHTTVIHSCEKIKEGLKTDHELVNQLNQIRSML
jgi:chromosomal replication initiator protein